MQEHILKRFLKYISIDTRSEDDMTCFPSTKKQLDLAKILYDECIELGLCDVTLDEYGYVSALLKSNTNKKVPSIGFLAHMDTAPDFDGSNVKPVITNNYDLGLIKLKNDVVISPLEFKELKAYENHTLITSDGTTLLGADDKAGIAIIMSAIKYLIDHNEIKHGDIKIGFTPDEEVGRGVEYFDVKKFGADFAYTIDGGILGEFSYENFNAAKVIVEIEGKSVHPGYAKDVMINSVLIANDFLNQIPQNETPSNTDGYEGFYHVNDISGSIQNTKIIMIIRDFDKQNFENRKNFIKDIVFKLNTKYNNTIKQAIKLTIEDSYFNMKEVVMQNPKIIKLAEDAFNELGIDIINTPIRGGTDGSRLSFMGLACPNIFAGYLNPHGPYEVVSLEAMESATNIIVKISELNAL